MSGKPLAAEKRGDGRSVLFVFLASVCFSTGGLIIKLIPWSALAINGVRNLIGACVIGIYLAAIRHKPRMNRQIFAGTISMIGVTTLFTVANKLTTAANAIVLQFTAPVFVILLMALLYHKKPGRADVLTCILVMSGVLLFFIDGLQVGNLAGNAVAILSGVCYAGVFMMNEGEGADAISSCFYGQLLAGLIFSPLVLRETDFRPQVLLAVFLLGAVQVGLAYILFSIGIQGTHPVTASLITGLEPVMNPLWVALFYHEHVSPVALVGSVIVVGSIICYNLWMARERSRRERAAADA